MYIHTYMCSFWIALSDQLICLAGEWLYQPSGVRLRSAWVLSADVTLLAVVIVALFFLFSSLTLLQFRLFSAQLFAPISLGYNAIFFFTFLFIGIAHW